MKNIALNINPLQYPMENISIPRQQKNKNATSPINGEQKKAPFKSWTGGDAPTAPPKSKLKK